MLELQIWLGILSGTPCIREACQLQIQSFWCRGKWGNTGQRFSNPSTCITRGAVSNEFWPKIHVGRPPHMAHNIIENIYLRWRYHRKTNFSAVSGIPRSSGEYRTPHGVITDRGLRYSKVRNEPPHSLSSTLFVNEMDQSQLQCRKK